MQDDIGIHEEQSGGRLSAANRIVLDDLYDPQTTQARFVGHALLDPETKRLRASDALAYWTTKRVDAAKRDVANTAPPTVSAAPATSTNRTEALEGALAEMPRPGGPMIFWKALERTNKKQRDTLRAARDANETHRTEIDAGTR